MPLFITEKSFARREELLKYTNLLIREKAICKEEYEIISRFLHGEPMSAIASSFNASRQSIDQRLNRIVLRGKHIEEAKR